MKQPRIPISVKVTFLLDATKSFRDALKSNEEVRATKIYSNCFVNFNKTLIESEVHDINDADLLIKIGRKDLIKDYGEVIQQTDCCSANVLFNQWGEAHELCTECGEPMTIKEVFLYDMREWPDKNEDKEGNNAHLPR